MTITSLPEYFTINGKKIYFTNLNNLNNIFDNYEIETISFIKEWLQGKKEFTITTSGSTGTPKPIIISRDLMIISAKLTGQALDLKAGDRSLICMQTKYIAGLMMLVRGLELGLEMNIVNPDSNPLKNFDIHTHFDFTAMVPLQLFEIFNTEKSSGRIEILNNMKAILIGGGNISPLLEEMLQKLKSPVYHTYGMTETITHIALRRVNGKEKKDYFTVLNNVEISQDNRGCLVIKSPVTNNQPVITNDLVEIISDKSFYWLGRIDNVINTGGIKVQTEKVETALEKVFYKNQFPSATKFFISSENDDKFGNLLIAVIEHNQLSDEKIAVIKNDLSAYLGKYEIPKKFYFVEKILLTPNSKIDKIATLKNLYQIL